MFATPQEVQLDKFMVDNSNVKNILIPSSHWQTSISHLQGINLIEANDIVDLEVRRESLWFSEQIAIRIDSLLHTSNFASSGPESIIATYSHALALQFVEQVWTSTYWARSSIGSYCGSDQVIAVIPPASSLRKMSILDRTIVTASLNFLTRDGKLATQHVVARPKYLRPISLRRNARRLIRRGLIGSLYFMGRINRFHLSPKNSLGDRRRSALVLSHIRHPAHWIELIKRALPTATRDLVIVSDPNESYLSAKSYFKVLRLPRKSSDLEGRLEQACVELLGEATSSLELLKHLDTDFNRRFQPFMSTFQRHVDLYSAWLDYGNLKLIFTSDVFDLDKALLLSAVRRTNDGEVVSLPHSFLPINGPASPQNRSVRFVSSGVYRHPAVSGRELVIDRGDIAKAKGQTRPQHVCATDAVKPDILQVGYFPSGDMYGFLNSPVLLPNRLELYFLITELQNLFRYFRAPFPVNVIINPKTVYQDHGYWLDVKHVISENVHKNFTLRVMPPNASVADVAEKVDFAVCSQYFGSAETECILLGKPVITLLSDSFEDPPVLRGPSAIRLDLIKSLPDLELSPEATIISLKSKLKTIHQQQLRVLTDNGLVATHVLSQSELAEKLRRFLFEKNRT